MLDLVGLAVGSLEIRRHVVGNEFSGCRASDATVVVVSPSGVRQELLRRNNSSHGLDIFANASGDRNLHRLNTLAVDLGIGQRFGRTHCYRSRDCPSHLEVVEVHLASVEPVEHNMPSTLSHEAKQSWLRKGTKTAAH